MKRNNNRALSFLSLTTVIVLWQLSFILQWTDPLFLPPPSDIINVLIRDIKDGELLIHLFASLQRYFEGTGIGILSGWVFGLSIGLSSTTRSVLSPWVIALFAVPKIALLPLFILWFGTGETSKIAVIALGTGLPVAIYTWNAIDHVDEKWLLLGRAMHFNKVKTIVHIILPAALPEIFTGLKLASTIGIILLTASEMMGSHHGLGLYIVSSGSMALSEQVFAGVILLMILATLINGLILWLESRFLFWMKPVSKPAN